MKIVMHRGFCDAGLSFCARCSATFFQKPTGTDRPCIVKVIDDGQADVLEIVLYTDQRSLRFALTPELQEGLALEGWEYLADFAPALIRRGANRRWQGLKRNGATP
ncbi:MAG: hypothetical protein DCC57_07125 [Chloroflexi bacterium]|nr:MAG: hypothetical protein DCC57_07125 [Chloroflexota bacterium]